MLSKCKGQFLRVTGCLKALFAIRDIEEDLQITVVHEDAVKAAINFVHTCMNHTTFLCG